MKEFNQIHQPRAVVCPVEGCSFEVRRGKRSWKDLQHHLFTGHDVTGPQSHKLAHEAVSARSPAEPRT